LLLDSIVLSTTFHYHMALVMHVKSCCVVTKSSGHGEWTGVAKWRAVIMAEMHHVVPVERRY